MTTSRDMYGNDLAKSDSFGTPRNAAPVPSEVEPEPVTITCPDGAVYHRTSYSAPSEQEVTPEQAYNLDDDMAACERNEKRFQARQKKLAAYEAQDKIQVASQIAPDNSAVVLAMSNSHAELKERVRVLEEALKHLLSAAYEMTSPRSVAFQEADAEARAALSKGK